MGKWLGFGLAGMLCFSGCGIQSTTEQTRDEVIKSNVTQNALLDHMKSVDALTSRLLDGISKTNDAVHLQVLTVSLQNLFDPLNTSVLFPPTRMMPYAETFAKEASEEEITKMAYLLIQDASQGSTATTPEEQAKDELQRRVRLTGMGLICAFIPDAKWASILKTQIDERQRYETTAYAMAAARFNFIRDFFYNPLISMDRVNQGSLKDTSEWFGRLKSLATANYLNSIVLDIPNLGEHDTIALDDFKRLAQDGRDKVLSLPDFAKSPGGQKLLQVFEVNL
jgi:hypothetical protein